MDIMNPSSGLVVRSISAGGAKSRNFSSIRISAFIHCNGHKFSLKICDQIKLSTTLSATPEEIGLKIGMLTASVFPILGIALVIYNQILFF